jgi:DNA-directed RNA polymerase subunit RPC12/RpoP
MAGVDAGEQVPCPSCGQTVLQKAMIPVLGDEGSGVRYLCIACARALIVSVGDAEPGGPEADEGAAEAAEAAETPAPA